MKNKKYLSCGEFAHFTGINKRTLHYYNEIDLFKPRFTGDNGYFYYSIDQFAQLELILILRKVGLSIHDIKAYLKQPKDGQYTKMLEEKKKKLDDYIIQLKAIQNFIDQKLQHVQLSQQAKHEEIHLIHRPSQKIIISKPITGNYDDHDFSIAANFSKRLKDHFSLYDRFGSRISVQNLYEKQFNAYDCYYAYCPQDSNYFDEILPESTYIEAYCIGNWSLLEDIYKKIIDFANNNHLELKGYAYEEGLNEMSIDSLENYITRILIPVQEASN